MSELLINHLWILGVSLERVDVKESACTPPASLLLMNLKPFSCSTTGGCDGFLWEYCITYSFFYVNPRKKTEVVNSLNGF